MAEIWERQKDESNKAYHTFCIYRDLGPDRSLEKTREILGKSAGYTRWMQTWSSKYDWVTRAQAYDDYIEGKKRKKNEKEILEMAERHVKVAKAFLLIIAQALQQIDPAQLSPSDMAKWLEVATKLERLSRGVPTEIGKQEVQGQVTKRYEYDITQKIITDPEAAELADQLLQRAANSDTGMVRTHNKPWTMAAIRPPVAPEPEDS